MTADPPEIAIRVRDRDPNLAAQSAELVANEFIDYVVEQRLGDIARLQSAALAQGLTNIGNLVAAQFTAVDALSILEPVSVPGKPILPQTSRDITVGILLGIGAGLGAVLVIASVKDTISDPEELQRRFGVTPLGAIFRWPEPQPVGEPVMMVHQPTGGYSESFRQLRANLQFASAGRTARTLVVTSPGAGEGKSTITCNLAVALAQNGSRVVVVDADMRRPSVHRLFDLETREPGLSNFLADETLDADDIIREVSIAGVSIIPGGPNPPNPSELLGSPRMSHLIEAIKEKADFVLLDSPPILMVADGAVLASQVDGAIVAVEGTATRPSAIRACLTALAHTDVWIAGVVVNKIKRARFGYGYGYYYGDSGRDGTGSPDGHPRGRLRSLASKLRPGRNND